MSIGCRMGQFCACKLDGVGMPVKTLSLVCDHASPSTRPKTRINWYCSCICVSGADPVQRPLMTISACRM